MSFGAMAAWQALLLVAAAAAAAVWLFRLKVRPPRVNVPSLLLWRRVFEQPRELTWWERVRRAVSLAATVLVAVALAVAVTRPALRLAASSRGRMLIVLDSSWSMLGRTSGGETRWGLAVREARRLAASAAGEAVALATTADGLVEGPTSDLALLETAIDRLSPAGGEQAAWPSVSGADVVHFVTDGAVERSLDSAIVVHPVFEAAPNVAITAFGARPAAAGATAGEAFFEIANYSPAAQQVRLSITRNATVILDQAIPLEAGEAGRQVIPLGPTGGARLMARVSAPANALTIDDEAVAWVSGADPLTVTLVGDAPGPLGQLLLNDPGVNVSVVAPAAYRPGREDLVIFDRWLPAEAPSRPALCIAPPAAPWLGALTAEEQAPRWTISSGHPVLSGVDSLTLDIKRARAHEGPGLMPLARSERGTPLVSVVDAPDRRLVVLAFGVTDSNLALAPAFPVLVGNALEWLARPSYGVLRKPGPIELPASTTRVTAPDGQPVTLMRVGNRAVASLSRPGLYLVEAGGSRGVVGVNVGDPEVSNLQHTTLGTSGAPDSAAPSGSGRPWWMYAVALAFVLGAAEWWTWQRRLTV